MANWDIVMAYDGIGAAYIEEMGYPYPPALSGNRLPTTADMKWALEAQGNLALNYPNGDGSLYVYEQGEDGFAIDVRGFNWDEADATPGFNLDGSGETLEGSFVIRAMCELEAALLVTLCRRCGQLLLIPDHGGPAVVFQADMDPKRIAALYSEADRQEDSWAFFANALYAKSE